jgi:hypothetical protein
MDDIHKTIKMIISKKERKNGIPMKMFYSNLIAILPYIKILHFVSGKKGNEKVNIKEIIKENSYKVVKVL